MYPNRISRSFLSYYTKVLLGTCYLPLEELDVLLLALPNLRVMGYSYKMLLIVPVLIRSYQDAGWQFIAVHSIYYHPYLVKLATESRLEYLFLQVNVV